MGDEHALHTSDTTATVGFGQLKQTYGAFRKGYVWYFNRDSMGFLLYFIGT